MEDLIRSLIKFDCARNQDVIKWLQYIETVFDGLQLQASHKYIAVPSFLTNDAAIWFKHNQSNIPNWFAFKREIIAFFSSSYSSLSSNFLDRLELPVYEEPHKLGQEQDVLCVPAPGSTMSNKVLDNDNSSLDSADDNRINSFKDLEMTINDLDLQIQQQSANVAEDCDQLEQQDTFEGFTRTMDSLTANDSLINSVLPQRKLLAKPVVHPLVSEHSTSGIQAELKPIEQGAKVISLLTASQTLMPIVSSIDYSVRESPAMFQPKITLHSSKFKRHRYQSIQHNTINVASVFSRESFSIRLSHIHRHLSLKSIGMFSPLLCLFLTMLIRTGVGHNPTREFDFDKDQILNAAYILLFGTLSTISLTIRVNTSKTFVKTIDILRNLEALLIYGLT